MNESRSGKDPAPPGPFGDRFGGNAAENYERYFVPALGRPFAEDLVRVAALRPGERVLDVACGTGIVARLAARRVGPTGKVAGLDLNPGMLAVARSVAPPELSIEWHESSAEAMPLPDEAFDAVLCQVSLQFMPDKVRVLREMRRVLVPGGRLVVSVPGPTPPLFAVVEEALRRHIGATAAGFIGMVFSLDDPDDLRSLLTEAGLRDVAVRQEQKEPNLPPPEEFLWQYVQSTPLAAPVGQAGAGARAALEREVLERWRQLPGGWRLAQDVLIATALR